VTSFHGRSIPDPGFAGDTGVADSRLVAALERRADDPTRRPAVLAALHGARLFTPVVAVLGEVDRDADGRAHDKTSDMALPLLVADDGARAVPVFSSLATLAEWDPASRPVPVESVRAASVALAEGASAAVLDVASQHRVTLGLAELRALVQGRGRVPAYDDEALRVAFHQALRGVTDVRCAWLHPAAGVDARLILRAAAETPAERVAQDAARAVSDLVQRAAVRGIDLAVLPADAPDPVGPRVFTR
jgi:hypothetical protein